MPDGNSTPWTWSQPEVDPAAARRAAFERGLDALERDKAEVRNAPTADLRGLYSLLGVPDEMLDPVAQTIESYVPLGVTESGNPDFYGPLTRAFARAAGADADEAARWAAGPYGAATRSRDVFEALIGPEELIGGLNRIGAGEGGFWDYANTALVAAPGPIGKAIKRFAIDPLARGYRRLFPKGASAEAGEFIDDAYRAVEDFDPREDVTEYLTRMTQRLFDAGATRDELEQFLAQYGRRFSDADELGRVVQLRDAAPLAAQPRVSDFSVAPNVNGGM